MPTKRKSIDKNNDTTPTKLQKSEVEIVDDEKQVQTSNNPEVPKSNNIKIEKLPVDSKDFNEFAREFTKMPSDPSIEHVGIVCRDNYILNAPLLLLKLMCPKILILPMEVNDKAQKAYYLLQEKHVNDVATFLSFIIPPFSMNAKMTSSNVSIVLEFAYLFDIDQLKKHCQDYVKETIGTWSRYDGINIFGNCYTKGLAQLFDIAIQVKDVEICYSCCKEFAMMIHTGDRYIPQITSWPLTKQAMVFQVVCAYAQKKKDENGGSFHTQNIDKIIKSFVPSEDVKKQVTVLVQQ